MAKPNQNRIISGLFIILISLGWLAFNINLFYRYHFTSASFQIVLPDWILFLNMLMSVAGILIGVSFLRKGQPLKGAKLFFLVLSIVTILINILFL